MTRDMAGPAGKAGGPSGHLQTHRAAHGFLIAIDSDGCVFDTMELKQKECFIPLSCKHFGFQPIAKHARTAAEFVNLHSRWRGQNRFTALVKVLDVLEEMPEVKARGFKVPRMAGLRRWVAEETRLSNASLAAYCQIHDDPDLERVLGWSEAVNRAVAGMMQAGIPPFPHVRKCLEKARARADMMVCSQTPAEALAREWRQHGLDAFVFAICGQEAGTKAEHIAAASGGRYPRERVLMVGDALGDMRAAEANQALFYPILPGREEASWRRLAEEGLDRLFTGAFAGPYARELAAEFEACLPIEYAPRPPADLKHPHPYGINRVPSIRGSSVGRAGGC